MKSWKNFSEQFPYLWCVHRVWTHGCLDEATDTMGLSEGCFQWGVQPWALSVELVDSEGNAGSNSESEYNSQKSNNEADQDEEGWMPKYSAAVGPNKNGGLDELGDWDLNANCDWTLCCKYCDKYLPVSLSEEFERLHKMLNEKSIYDGPHSLYNPPNPYHCCLHPATARLEYCSRHQHKHTLAGVLLNAIWAVALPVDLWQCSCLHWRKLLIYHWTMSFMSTSTTPWQLSASTRHLVLEGNMHLMER